MSGVHHREHLSPERATLRRPVHVPSPTDRRIERIRRQIESGTYDEDAKLDAVLDKILDDLGL
ncbi:MAG TPA: flagellar biosynthesis anti-sigma factor FlgM [Tepidisphaeraceae bacterium]|nr:flagellar biosynthesis anti-sigma factor FlgM [Tepidisphaeraceae bacterium]